MAYFLLLSVTCCLFLLSDLGHCALIQWINSDGGAWNIPANWQPARVPQTGDQVLAEASGRHYTITVNTAVTIQSLMISEAGVTLNVANSLTVVGPCEIEGQVYVFPQMSFTFGTRLKIGRNLTLQAGILKASGWPGSADIHGLFVIAFQYRWQSPVIDGVQITAHGSISWNGGGSGALVLRNRGVLNVPQQTHFVMATDGTVKGNDGLVVIDGDFTCRGFATRVTCKFESGFINNGSVLVDKSTLIFNHRSNTNGQLMVEQGGAVSLTGTHTFTSYSVIDSNGTISISGGSTSIFSSNLRLSRVTASGYRYANPLTRLLIVTPVGQQAVIGSISVKSVRVAILSTTNQELSMESIIVREVGALELSQSVTVRKLEIQETATVTLRGHLVITEKWLFSGGRLIGPGHVRLLGMADVNPVSRVSLQGIVLIMEGRMDISRTGSLQLEQQTVLKIAKTGVVSFVAPRCSILGSGNIENNGLIKTGVHHTGTSRIAVSLFKHNGNLSVESLLENTLEVQTNCLFTGAAEVSEKGKLLLSRAVDGLQSGSVSGKGSLVSTGSAVRLKTVKIPKIEVHGGMLEIATIGESVQLSELRMTGGSCTIYGRMEADDVVLSGGVLSLFSPSNLVRLKLSGTAFLDVNSKVVVHDTIQWIGGTFNGTNSQQVLVKSLTAYETTAKTIQSVTVAISGSAKFHGYGMAVELNNGAVLEISTGATAEVAGGSIAFNSKDGSSIWRNIGQMALLATNTRLLLSLHNVGQIKVDAGLLDIRHPSQNDGTIIVSKSSTLRLSSTLLSSEVAEIKGGGLLQLSYQSREIIPIPNISMKSVEVVHGRHYLRLQSSFDKLSSLKVSSGQLFVDKDSVSNSDRSVTAEEVSVHGGNLVVLVELNVDKFIMRGGFMEYHRNVVVTGQMVWAAGTLLGNSTLEPQIFMKGSLEFINSDDKILQSVKLLVQSDAVWRGYGNVRFSHSSIVRVQPGAHFTIDTTASVLSDRYSDSIINDGKIVISENREVHIEVNLQNTGSVVFQSASSVSLSGNSYWLNGSVMVSDKAELSFVRGEHRIPSNTNLITSSTSTLKVLGGDVHVQRLGIPGELQVSGGTMIIDVAEPTTYISSVSVSNHGILTVSGGNSDTKLGLKDVVISTDQYLKINRPLQIDHLELTSGSILGSAEIEVKKLTWNGGSISGRKDAVVNITTAMRMDHAHSKQISGRHVIVSGQGDWTGTGDLLVVDGATLDIMNDTYISIDAPMTLRSADGGVVRNYGELIYSPRIYFHSQLNLEGSIINYGLISGRGQTGMTLGAGMITYGTVEVTNQRAWCRVRLGDVVVKGGGQLKASGSLVMTGGRLLVEGQLVVNVVELNGGSLLIRNESDSLSLDKVTLSRRSSSIGGHFLSHAPLFVETVMIDGGTLESYAPSRFAKVAMNRGTLSLNVNFTEVEKFSWYGGSLTGYGSLTVQNATIRRSTVPHSVTSQLQLFIRGVADFVGAPFDVSVGGDAVVTNEVGSTVKFNGGHRLTQTTGRIVNLGTMEWYSHDQRQASVSPQLKNNGHIVVKTGTLILSGRCINEGRITVDAHATLEIRGGLYGTHLSNLDADGNVTVHSDVYLQFGTFDARGLSVHSGTLDLFTTTDMRVWSFKQLGGTIRITCLAGAVFGGHLLSFSGGSTEIIGHARLWEATLDGGSLLLSEDASIGDKLTVKGGSLSGMLNAVRVRLNTPRLIVDDSATRTYRSGNRFDIRFNNLEIVVDESGLWVTKGSGSIVMTVDSQITVSSGAAFNVSVSSSSSINGGTVFNLGNINIIAGTHATAGSLSINGDFVNLGVFSVQSEIAVYFHRTVRCSVPGSISAVGEELAFFASAELNCSVSGRKLLAGKSSVVRVSSHGSLRLESLHISDGSIEVLNHHDLDLLSLEMTNGVMRAADGVNITVTVSEMWRSTGGVFTKLSIRSLQMSHISTSTRLESSRIALSGQATFTDSTVALDRNSILHFVSGSMTNIVRSFNVGGVAANSVGTVINDGFIQVSWPGTRVTTDVTFHHRGTLRLNGMAMQLTLRREFHMEDGIVIVVGHQSTLNLVGSSSSRMVLNASSSFCKSCRVSLAGGVLQLVAQNGHPWTLPSLLVSQGRVVAQEDWMMNSQITLDDVQVTGAKSEMELTRLMYVKRLLLTNGGHLVAMGRTVNMENVVFSGGEIRGDTETTVETEVHRLTLRSSDVKYVRRTRLVVTKSLSMIQTSVLLDVNSSFVISSSARALISGPDVKISSEKNVLGASFENNGILQIVLDDGHSASVGIYAINTGTLHVVNGLLILAGDSEIGGNVIVEKDASVEFRQSDNVISSRNLSSYGIIRTVSGSQRRTTLDIRSTPVSLRTLEVHGGNVSLSSSLCLYALHIFRGRVNIVKSVGVNRFVLREGNLYSPSRLDVNGAATWTGGSIPSGVVVFNGLVDIAPNLQGSPLITNSGTRCSNHTSCAACLGDSSCVWYDDGNNCVSTPVYNDIVMKCASWTLAASQCQPEPSCSRFVDEDTCEASADCAWCAATSACHALSEPCGDANTVYWSSDSSGSWSDSSRWSSGRVPTASDNVIIVKNTNVWFPCCSPRAVKSLVLGSHHHSVTDQPTLQIQYGQLTVQGSIEVAKGARIIVSSNLVWTGTARIEGVLEWKGQDMRGGQLTVSGSLIMVLPRYQTRSLNSDVTVEGTVSVESSNVVVGLGSGKKFHITPSGRMNVRAVGARLKGSLSSFVNNGSLSISGREGFTIESSFKNFGHVQVASGSRLYLNKATSLEGDITVGEDDLEPSYLYISPDNGIVGANCRMRGTGTVVFRSGSIAIKSNLKDVAEVQFEGSSASLEIFQSFQRMSLRGGTVTTAANCTVVGRAVIEYGTLQGDSTWTFTGPVVFRADYYWNSRTLKLHDVTLAIGSDAVVMSRDGVSISRSALTVTGSDGANIIVDKKGKLALDSIGWFRMTGARLINHGQLLLSTQSDFTVSGAPVINSGKIVAATLQPCAFNAGLNNSGDVTVLRNVLSVRGGLVSFPHSSVTVSGGSRLDLLDGDSTFHPRSILRVDGTLRVSGQSAHVLLLNVQLISAQHIQLSVGSMNIIEPTNVSSIGAIIADNNYNQQTFEFRHSSGEVSVESIKVTRQTTVKLTGRFRVGSLEVAAGLLQLIDAIVFTDRLQWTTGIIEGSVNSQGTAVVNVGQLDLRGSSTKTLRIVQLIVRHSVRTDNAATLSLRDAHVLVPQGASTTVTTESILRLQQQGMSTLTVSGRLAVRKVHSKVTGSKGLDVSVSFRCPGFLTLDDANLWLNSESNVSGNIEVSQLGSIHLGGSSHYWTGKLRSMGSISLSVGSPQLTIQSPSASMDQLSISRGRLTLDVEPTMLELRRVSISTHHSSVSSSLDYSRLYCQQNCSISEELLWHGGLIGSIAENVLTTVKNIVVTSQYRRLYTGNGLFVVQGTMYLQDRQTTRELFLGGPCLIEKQGSLDVQGSFSVLSSSRASLTTDGDITVGHGATMSVSVPFWTKGETTVFGLLKTTSDGTHNRLNLADPSAVLAVGGSGKQEIGKSARVAGSGRIRVEGGTLMIFCSLLPPMFTGRVEVSAGSLTFNGSSAALNVSSVSVAGGSFRLVQTSNARMTAASVSERGRLTVLDSRNTAVETLSLECSSQCTLDGNSNVTVGEFSWKRSGIVTGSVTVVSRHLAISDYNQRLDGGRVIIDHSATITGTSNLYFYLTSPGKIIISLGATVTIVGKRTIRPIYRRSRGVIENAGTLRVWTTANDDVNFETGIVNTGSIVFLRGLTTFSSLTIAGNITGEERSVLRLTGAVTFSPDSIVNLHSTDVISQGTVNFNSHASDNKIKSLTVSQTFRVNSPRGLTVLRDLTFISGTLQVSTRMSTARLLFRSGTISGTQSSSAMEVSEMLWTSGTVRSSRTTEFLTVADLLVMKSNSYKSIDRCGVVALRKTIVTQKSNLNMRNGAHLYNRGQLTLDSSGTAIGYRYYPSSITNNGTIIVRGGTGSVNVHSTLINGGEIIIRDGTLTLFKDSVSDPGAQLDVADGSSIHFASGSHSFLAASRLLFGFTAKLQASNRAVVTLDSNETHLMIPYLSSSSGAHLIFNTTAVIDKTVLDEGSLTLKGRSQVKELEMKGNQASLKGGRPGFVCRISIGSLIFDGGSIVTASSSGKYLFVNVTERLLFNGVGWQWINRADVLVYGTAVIGTSAGVSLTGGSRLVITRRATLRLVHGAVSYRYGTASHYYRDRLVTGFLVNVGSLTIEATGQEARLHILTPLINTNGRIDVLLGVLQLDGGGESNGTRDVIDVQNRAKIQFSSYQYQMLTEALSGEGEIEIASSNVLFTSGPVAVPITVSGGSVTVPSGVTVNFTRSVRAVGGGILSVQGIATIGNSLEIIGPTSRIGDTGNEGIVRIEKQATLSFSPAASFSQVIDIHVPVHNYGQVDMKRLVRLNALWRNEKQGRVHLFGEGRLISSGSGRFENVGLFRCTDLSNVRCSTSARLTNYGAVDVANGTLAISNSRLYDGSTIGGLGTVETSSGIEAGGIMDGMIVVVGGLTVEGPLFIRGQFVWNNGALVAKASMCGSSDYFSSNVILKTSCQESYIVNQGMVVVGTNAVKTLRPGLHFSNRGAIHWSGGELQLQGPFVNEQSGSMYVQSHDVTSMKLTGSFSNHGSFSIIESSISVNGHITSDGAVRLETSSVQVSSYLQNSETSSLSLVESTLLGTSLRFNGGLVNGSGVLKGNVYNNGTVMVTRGQVLVVDGVYEQSGTGSLFIRIDKGNGGILVGALTVQGDARISGLLDIRWSSSAYSSLLPGQSYTVVSFMGMTAGTFNRVRSETDSGDSVKVSVMQEPGQVQVTVV